MPFATSLNLQPLFNEYLLQLQKLIFKLEAVPEVITCYAFSVLFLALAFFVLAPLNSLAIGWQVMQQHKSGSCAIFTVSVAFVMPQYLIPNSLQLITYKAFSCKNAMISPQFQYNHQNKHSKSFPPLHKSYPSTLTKNPSKIVTCLSLSLDEPSSSFRSEPGCPCPKPNNSLKNSIDKWYLYCAFYLPLHAMQHNFYFYEENQ